MASYNWSQVLPPLLQVPGPTLTAAGGASMLVASTPIAGQQHFTWPANAFKTADILKFTARGYISTAATTPGSARFDLRFGTIVVFDTLPMALSASQTNALWTLDVDLSIRTLGAGTAATVYSHGTFSSPAVGGGLQVGGLVSNGFSTDVSFLIDSFFTQIVGTGSMTAQIAYLDYKT